MEMGREVEKSDAVVACWRCDRGGDCWGVVACVRYLLWVVADVRLRAS